MILIFLSLKRSLTSSSISEPYSHILQLRIIHVDDEYTRIFVGRENDIDLLSRRFDGRIADKSPPMVYSYFNAPGIGKTTLLRKFGEKIENEGRGLHIYFSCKSHYTDEFSFYFHLFRILMTKVEEKQDLVESFIDSSKDKVQLEENFLFYKGYLQEIADRKKYNVDTVSTLFDLLLNVIPVFFSTDEIQQLQKIYVADEYTMLQSFADFLANLLTSKVLLTISGTQYSIMSQISYGIGSTINGKIQSVVISSLKSDHIRQYITEFRKLYPGQPCTEALESYLIGFSGGHPRTIERIVESFFALDKTHDFTEILTEEVSTLLSHTILDSNKIEALRAMQSQSEFNPLKEWVLHALNTNLHLGKNPRREMEPLVFELMTMGIIVQNGSSDYYITSYFHGLAFLETLIGEYEQFLYQVLNNRYFREMVGGHSGLGFTFERIIFASLILHGNTGNQSKQLIFNVKNLNRIETVNFQDLKKSLDVEIRQDTLYSLPNAKDVDGIFKVEDEIILVQITTKQSGILEKFHNFERAAQECNVKGWFITLYAEDIEETSNSKITSGSEVAEILGEKLYQRMLEVKGFLKTKI